MKQLLFSGTTVLLLNFLGTPAAAQVSINIGIPLPPPIVFSAPPNVVVLPESEVYVVPDVREDIFFFDGWWWRPWEGRWYRSHHHDRGWAHYQGVPSFYRNVPPRWRDDYHARRWSGGNWNHAPIPHHDLNKNWKNWRETRYWERPEHRQYERKGPDHDPGDRGHEGRGHEGRGHEKKEHEDKGRGKGHGKEKHRRD